MAKTYWDTLPAKQIRLAQEQKLISYLRQQVFPMSPFYRELFEQQELKIDDIRSLEDFQKLPFTCKADIAPASEDPQRPFKLVLQPLEAVPDTKGLRALSLKWKKLVLGENKYKQRLLQDFNPSHVHFTTGRTALPTPIFYTPSDLTLTRECGRRMAEVINLRTENTLVNAFPFAPHLSFWMAYFSAETVGAAAIHTGGGKVLGSGRILDALERFSADTLSGTPGYCYHLLRLATMDKRDLSSLKALVLGGERVPEGMRVKMQDLLRQAGASNVRIFSSYAFTEGRVAWMECREAVEKGESSGYHLYPDREFIEIIDPESGEPVGEGEEGEIVYTSLGWHGSVLLRYRTGDTVKEGLTFEPCPHCKRTVPRLGSTINRLSENKEFQLTKLKGTLVDLNAFYPLLSGHPGVQEWQLVIGKRNDDPFDLDELYLFVAPMEGFKEKTLKLELEDLILRELEITPSRITFQSLDKLLDRLGLETHTKELRIVDQRSAGGN
jgi:phenylacetate-CoA ligase